VTGPLIIADDFGLCEKHDNVIIELIKQKKINAVSVMVHPDLKSSRRIDLLKVENNLSIGLHLNLTILLPKNKITNTSTRLLLNNFLVKNNNKIIAQKIQFQINLFEEIFDKFPDFIDGHEHIHIFPNIFRALTKILTSRSLPSKFWVRSPAPSTLSDLYREYQNAGIKVIIISFFGILARKKLKSLNLKSNMNFFGFLKLNTTSKNFEKIYNRNLSLLKNNMTLMVHPGDAESLIYIKGHSNKIRALEAKILKNSEINLR
jgi:predicted glycoside hydrolase/deacetylase ChbG (UPF0249 family)|tara:strand:+ start:2059 stop:2841 length:783 start_codon:yes stop_codon:yes gene_type:complete